MRFLIALGLFCGIGLSVYGQSKDIPLNSSYGYNTTGDTFAYKDKRIGNYSLGWYSVPGSAEALFSGFGGIRFFTFGGKMRFIITQSGNLGIGTENPQAKLHIKNSNNTYGAILANANETPFQLYTKTLTTAVDTESFRLGLKYNSNEKNGFISFYRGQSTEGGFLGFSTHGIERIRISRSGNVGIGTASPSEKLDVRGVLKVSSGSYSSIQIGNERNDRIIADNKGDNTYGSGYFFRVHDESVSYKYRDAMMISKNGNIGINVHKPTAKLEIKGVLKSFTTDISKNIKLFGGNSGNFIDSQNNDLYLRVDGNSNKAMVLKKNGDIGIGITDTKGFKLGVNGKIAATEVKVALYNNWADFVFYKDYNLPTLEEVANHIAEKGHLKDIPSAEEVAKDGFYLGEMDAKLLQKIEELTLYTIQQEKEIQRLTKENQETKKLANQLLELTKRLEALEKK